MLNTRNWNGVSDFLYFGPLEQPDLLKPLQRDYPSLMSGQILKL